MSEHHKYADGMIVGKDSKRDKALLKLVPDEGPVKNPRTNKALERFRKMHNLLYDMDNNGFCNTSKRKFKSVFGIEAEEIDWNYGRMFNVRDTKLYNAAWYKLRPIVIGIINDAWVEQWEKGAIIA